MKLTFEEEENIKKIMCHMNENHLSEDGEPENPWSENDAICAVFHEGIELIMRRHNIS